MNNRNAMLGVLLCMAGAACIGSVHAQELHACANGAGILRLVDAASDCQSEERAVSWSVVGPAGPRGESGPEGPAGPSGPPGPSVGDPQFVYVGNSDDRFNGQFGIGQFNIACAETYGEGARTCTSREIIRSGDAAAFRFNDGPFGQPPTTNFRAWVQPEIIFGADGGDEGMLVLDYSGAKNKGFGAGLAGSGLGPEVRRGELSCRAWTSQNDETTGLSLAANRLLVESTCDRMQKVACCAPVEAEEPSPAR